jgi:hypothetical protein
MNLLMRFVAFLNWLIVFFLSFLFSYACVEESCLVILFNDLDFFFNWYRDCGKQVYLGK